MSLVNRLTKNYWQLIVVVALSGAAAPRGIAQSYFHSPNDTLIANTIVNNSVTLNITQVHPTNDTLRFVWEKLFVSMPNEWTAMICDNNTCYPSLIDSSTTLPVLPGDDGLMLIHCYPNTNSGTGIIRYSIYEIHTPNQVDTLTWIINASGTVGLPISDPQTALYTLSGNQFKLSENALIYTRLIVTDLTGKEVFSSLILPNQSMELPLISSAYYYITLKGNTNIIHQKIWYTAN